MAQPAPRRRKAAAAPNNKPMAAKKARPYNLSIAMLYKNFANDITDESHRQLEEGGAAQEVIWPYLSSAKKRDEEWRQACELLVVAVVVQDRPPLDFMNNADALLQVLDTLLFQVELTASIVHFVTVLLASELKEITNCVQEYLAGVKLCHFMPVRRLEYELKKSAGLRRRLAQTEKPAKFWVVQWIEKILTTLQGPSHENREFLYRSLELLVDMLSAIVTRQYLVMYLDAIHFVVRCKRSSQDDKLTLQLLQRVYRLGAFPIRDKTALSKEDVTSIYHMRATILQKLLHRHYPDASPEVIYAGVGLLCNGKYLPRAMGGLSDVQIMDVLYRIRLIESKESFQGDRELMMDILMHHVTIPPYPLDQLRTIPLYPTENILWDHNIIPPNRTRTNTVLSLPKLQTQFLSYQDYLLRNFELLRLESAYEIRSDLVDVVRRVRPVVRQKVAEEINDMVLKTDFTGWARMALEVEKPIRLARVGPPKIGDNIPSQVIAEIQIDLVHCGLSIRKEWDSLAEFDNLFLVVIDAATMSGEPAPTHGDNIRVPDDEDSTFAKRYGVKAVRGCMVLQVRDEDGTILSDPSLQANEHRHRGTKRILRVALDPAQYSMDSKSKRGTDVYQAVNLIIRRQGRENNFKAVLETIRGLMEGSGSIERVIPQWLQPLLLGYGDPSSASYKSDAIKSFATKTPGVANPDAALDFGDTFVDEAHLRESFPHFNVIVDGKQEPNKEKYCKRLNYKVRIQVDESAGRVAEVTSYSFDEETIGNPVRFTPVQVEAIRSGLSLGLTLVVGPPGTGKTDTVVQIITSLYHSYPSQRTVIITHSNAALNDIFEKVMARGDIDERYMIRLGSGERDLNIESSHDFTKTGRVAHSLSRRSVLLEQVQLLSESLGVSTKAERGTDGSASYTCETAEYFNRHYIQKHIQIFKARTAGSMAKLDETFPFKTYFSTGSENLTIEEARKKIERIESMFRELAEYRPLEMLRSQRQRTDYFLLKQAKIVAMTCTHAAIARSHLVELGFHYDNLVVEEAAQMLEVETFVPMLLQRGESDKAASSLSRLKRICLVGDHNQLPPVVKNMSFAKFSNLDQSLFTRLIRMGVPFIQLNKQGRARADIAKLYSWRYKDLGDLDHVFALDRFKRSNPGFVHTFQFINVENFEGKGETTPTAHFYQNVGEAEFAVAMFQYMVLIGYPAEKISILTTYNGQKELLHDILSQRCGSGTPFSGIRPKAVSTVDQYQGQQNDVILLSLVRTESVGHLRDVRRLIVAVSRAQLGLYVLGRQGLFQDCHELKQTMDRFAARPNKLQLVLGEQYPCDRQIGEKVDKGKTFEIQDVSHMGSIVYSMQQDWVR